MQCGHAKLQQFVTAHRSYLRSETIGVLQTRILTGLNALNGDRCFDYTKVRVVEIIAKRDVCSAMDHANCDEFGAGTRRERTFLMATTKLIDSYGSIGRFELAQALFDGTTAFPTLRRMRSVWVSIDRALRQWLPLWSLPFFWNATCCAR